MAAAAPRRVPRPGDKEEVIQRLLVTKDGPFTEIRDVLTFAAALGYQEGRRIPLTSRGEAIRWDTFKNRRGTEQLVGLIAVGGSEDREIVADSRFDEQIEAFAEYANGGLEVIRERLNQSHRLAREVILEMVQDSLTEERHDDDPLGLGGVGL